MVVDPPHSPSRERAGRERKTALRSVCDYRKNKPWRRTCFRMNSHYRIVVVGGGGEGHVRDVLRVIP